MIVEQAKDFDGWLSQQTTFGQMMAQASPAPVSALLASANAGSTPANEGMR